MTTKFKELLRYLLTELYAPKIGPVPIFGSFFSENRHRVNFGMGFFSENPGRVGDVSKCMRSKNVIAIKKYGSNILRQRQLH